MVEGGEILDDIEPRLHRATRVVLVGLGVAEVDQHAVAEILGDGPVESPDGGGHLLIRPDNLTKVFGVEPSGEIRGAHEIAEHDGELSAFRLRGATGRDRRCARFGLVRERRDGLPHRAQVRGPGRRAGRWASGFAGPDEYWQPTPGAWMALKPMAVA